MNERFEKLQEKHPVISFMLMIAMIAAVFAALIGADALAKWIGGTL